VAPAPRKRLRDASGYATQFLQIFYFCSGFLILAPTLQAEEPECDSIIPRLQRLKRYQGWWPPGFGSGCDPWRCSDHERSGGSGVLLADANGSYDSKLALEVDMTTTASIAGTTGLVAEAAKAEHNSGAGVPEVSPSTCVASAGGGATMTGDEVKVVMGHPGLRAPGQVSLSEVMGTTHFTLRQA
jgi:hypothetical protein